MQRVKSYRFWQTQILWYCFILFLCMQSYHRLIINASCHVTLGSTVVVFALFVVYVHCILQAMPSTWVSFHIWAVNNIIPALLHRHLQGLFQKHYKHAVRYWVDLALLQIILPAHLAGIFGVYRLHTLTAFNALCTTARAAVASEVPACTHPCGQRINLTFRWIKVKVATAACLLTTY